MNQACQRWLNLAQLQNAEKSNDNTNSRESANSLRIWECLDRISDIGESAYADYVTPGFTWKMQYTMIAKEGARKAYVTTSVNPEYAFMSTNSADDSGSNSVTRNNIWTAVMESESAFFYWKDSSRRFLGANRAFLELYQKDLSDLYGKRYEEVIGGPMAADLAEKEQKVLETGITIRDSINVTLAGGREHQIMTTMAPINHEGKIVGLVGQSMDITMVEEERKSLAQEILKDPLTGIPNRRGFNRFMDQLACDTSVKEAYIVNADINKFKSFNDRYGHAIGDILLKSFAEEAVAFVGDRGTVSRNGGDEFQFFFPNPASGFSSRLQEFFNRDHEFRAGGILYRYSISGGVAIYPDMSRDVQELYDRADIALYHAKLDPHHNIALYNELMKEESREGMGLTFSDLAAGEPASVLIYRYDETEEILYANENCLKLFDCENTQEFMKLTGRSFRTLIHPDDRETTERDISLQQANPDNDGYDFIIFRILTRDGKEKEIMDIGRKIHDPYYGDLFYVLLWDNKELLRMFRRPHYDTVQQLGGGSGTDNNNGGSNDYNNSNDYDIGELTDFLQLLPGGMHRCYLSSPGHLEWCSPSLIRMLGYEEDEFHDLVGSIYVKIMAKEDWGSFVELGRRLSVKPGVGSCFYHLIKKDGTRIPCIEVMQSALGPDGIMYGYANVMDISTIIRDVPLPNLAK